MTHPPFNFGVGLAAIVAAVAALLFAAAVGNFEYVHMLEVLGPWLTVGLVVARQVSMHGENKRALADLTEEVKRLRGGLERHINQHLEGRL